MNKVALAFLTVLLISSLVFIGCNKEKAEETAASEPVEAQVVTMAGPFVDSDAVKFENSIKAFEESNRYRHSVRRFQGSSKLPSVSALRAAILPISRTSPSRVFWTAFVAQGYVINLKRRSGYEQGEIQLHPELVVTWPPWNPLMVP